MAFDIDISHYSTGTATVAAGSTTVTGQGTTWTALRKGDLFGTHVGAPVRIAWVNSNTSLTLAYPWTGPAQAEAPYEIQRTPYDIGYLTAIEDLLRKLGLGVLPQLADLALGARKVLATDASGDLIQTDLQDWTKGLLGLTGAADKLIHLDNTGTAALADLTELALAILAAPDSSTLLSEIGAQPDSDILSALAGLTPVADRFPYFTGAAAIALATLTAQARTLLAAADGAAQFQAMGAAGTLAQNGFTRLPNGLIVQWGQSGGGGPTGIVTLPTAYPNANWLVVGSILSLSTTHSFSAMFGARTLTSFQYSKTYSTTAGTGQATSESFMWISMGY